MIRYIPFIMKVRKKFIIELFPMKMVCLCISKPKNNLADTYNLDEPWWGPPMACLRQYDVKYVHWELICTLGANHP